MSIFVYSENWEGKFKKQSFELISYGRQVADLTGKSLTAFTIGEVADEELSKLAKYGADKIVRVDNNAMHTFDARVYTAAIKQLVDSESASILILAHNSAGKALAPRLSVRMGAGLATAVTGLPSEMNPVTFPKKVFSGKAITQQVIHTDKAILTLAPNAFEVVEKHKPVNIQVFNPIGLPDVAVEVMNTTRQVGKVLLNDAEIVVSGGRGMKSADNWAPIEELADLLGAATACSRPVSDEGWRSHAEHTGQTGKIIAPNLYFAFGISGAIQHLAGVSSSKCIVAVNTDPDAPIFEAADYGIVGDALKVLPNIISAVKELKAQ